MKSLALVLALAFPAAAAEDKPAEGIEWVTPQELKEAIDAGTGLIIVDVRSETSYRKGHIPGAINIPYEVIKSNEKLGVKPTDMIVLYCDCGHGGIALSAAKILKDRGYSNLWVMLGTSSDYPGELDKSPEEWQ
ncbi:MAG: rhodanese-like domain-containing protein [Candidatus Hydrothermia bacterium]